MCFKGLLLDKGLEADMALEGPHTGMDQHVSLQVGRQGELSGTDITLEFLHTLGKQKPNKQTNKKLFSSSNYFGSCRGK